MTPFTAVHSVIEHISLRNDESQRAPVVATNIYVRGALGWRMVAASRLAGTARHRSNDDAQDACIEDAITNMESMNPSPRKSSRPTTFAASSTSR